MDTMERYSHTARRGQEKRTQWKEVPGDTVREGLHQGLAFVSF